MRVLPTLPRLKAAVRAALGIGDAAMLRALDAQLAQWASALTVYSRDETMTAHVLKLRALVLLKLDADEAACHALTMASHVLGCDASLWAALSVALSRLGACEDAARAVTCAYAVCHGRELYAKLNRVIRSGDASDAL